MREPTIIRPCAQLHVKLQTSSIVVRFNRPGRCESAAWIQMNCRGSRPRSCMKHLDGLASLTPSLLFSTACNHFWIGLSSLYLVAGRGSPALTCKHTSWDCLCFEEQNLGTQSVCKLMSLNTLFYSESISCEWSQSCISCNIEVQSFVTHQA